MWVRNLKGPLAAIGILLFLPYACGMATSKIIYVDINAVGHNDGSSWTDAYNCLQDALAAAELSGEPVEIRLAGGIYKPDRGRLVKVGDRLAGFELTNGVVIKGGYGGNGHADPNIRDVNLYETILSGDLEGNDRLPSFLDCAATDPMVDASRWDELQDNSQNLITCHGDKATVVLDGLTICNGYPGPAMRVTSGNVRIIDVVFRHNLGGAASALYCEKSCIAAVGCRFSDNCSPFSTVYLKDTEVIFLGCAFVGNFSNEKGVSGGVGLFGDNSHVLILDSTFLGNRAFETGRPIVDMNEGYMLATNCIFAGNMAISGACILGSDTMLRLDNCTFHLNLGRSIISKSYQASISSCIFLEQMSWPIENHPGSVMEIRYSDITGGSSAVLNLDPNGGLIWGEGNIDAEPLFARPGYWDYRGTPDDPYDDIWVDGDYHLKSQAGRWDPVSQAWVKDDVTSPCIDAGDPTIPVVEEPFPNGGRINMGAYGGTQEASKSYFGGPTCDTIVSGDIDGDCKVDLQDLAILASHWLEGW